MVRRSGVKQVGIDRNAPEVQDSTLIGTTTGENVFVFCIVQHPGIGR